MSGADDKPPSTALALYQVLTGDEIDVPGKKEFLEDLTRVIDDRVQMEHAP
jgi:hypothetical protein